MIKVLIRLRGAQAGLHLCCSQSRKVRVSCIYAHMMLKPMRLPGLRLATLLYPLEQSMSSIVVSFAISLDPDLVWSVFHPNCLTLLIGVPEILFWKSIWKKFLQDEKQGCKIQLVFLIFSVGFSTIWTVNAHKCHTDWEMYRNIGIYLYLRIIFDKVLMCLLDWCKMEQMFILPFIFS